MKTRKPGLVGRSPNPVAWWPLVLSLSFLAACGGQQTRPPETAGSSLEPARAAAKAPRKSNVVQKRGGAYYKDDGPGDEIPDNLDDVPDAQPRLEPLHRFANRPYVVLGKAYEPHASLRPHQERGIASWYGKKFHGQKTSIGEPYDMFAMTAAHPTLAIPSYVRVTNVSNGKSVVVRVTDRGPFHADRVIDLSYLAAYRLGYVDNGSTLVNVESILPEGATTMTYAQVMPVARPQRPVGGSVERDEIELLAAKLSLDKPPVSSMATGGPSPALSSAAASASSASMRSVFLQLGAFASAENAESLRSHLLRELDWLSEGVQINAGGGMHRVHLGPYASRADAERVAERIRLALGYKPTFVAR
ncbi:MAG: septal ring lytic transglycosylase RlpA family protein [Candidatus Accumulibacter sp.]|jgi:rare lipoprotein A|nr:septal ring lytic transglycosylase RlpA family protein [Accumulibacter sp.]MBK8385080.1 septal ring lytic transglycosylase RlpA family protein [Accumulibacter sp.]MBK8577171.1 septal ring lytic transglycosylase RlpA family protein [Candidatus Accumulibacter propinquus]MBN8437488.1 septal ring lytic transglycosylase RlpA family protein [Accumulibacter sp.]